MAELVQYRNQATSKDANGALSVVASRKVIVTRRGASVNGAQTGTLTSITVHSGALRFADNNVIQVEGDITKLAVVNGTPTVDTAIPIDSVALTVADNARLVNLGTDSSAGTGTPAYDGADALLAIYDEPLSTGTAIVDNQVTTDADGEYGFWAAAGVVDISVMDTSDQLGADSQTDADVAIGTFARLEATAGTSQEDGINAAMVAAAGTGGVVELGPGTFTIDTAIDLQGGVWLRGAGMGVTIIKVKASTAINVIQQGGTSLLSFVRVSDLTLDGNDANQVSGTGLGANIRNVSDLLVENVEIKNTRGQGVTITANDVSTERVVVRGCNIHDVCSATTGSFEAGIEISSTGALTVDDVLITGNILDKIGDGNPTPNSGEAINAGHTGLSTIISNNIMRNIQLSGVRLGKSGKANVIGNHMTNLGLSDTANGGVGIFASDVGNLLISDNTIDTIAANSDNGIEISGTAADRVIISNNRITNILNFAKACIFVGTDADTVITGNLCTASGVGISVTTSDGTTQNNKVISNNLIENPGADGIKCFGFANVSIVGNVVRSGVLRGIDVQEGTIVSGGETSEVAIVGNTVSDCTGDGIAFRGETVGVLAPDIIQRARRLVISGNVSHDNGDRGIEVVNAICVAITGNTVEGNSESGMRLSTIDDCVVSGNMIKNNGVGDVGTTDNDGILLHNTNDSMFIAGNSFIDNAGAGAFAINNTGATTTNLVIGDNFMRGNTAVSAVAITVQDVASAAALTLPNTANYFDITGTTNITSMTLTYPGHRVTLSFEGILTFTDGSNLKLAGNFVTTADDSITLVCDGVSWIEIGRSVN